MTERALPAGRKTREWDVLTNSNATLGIVRWLGAWRQYVFAPDFETEFNRDCLIDLANFLRRVNDEHRAALRNADEAAT